MKRKEIFFFVIVLFPLIYGMKENLNPYKIIDFFTNFSMYDFVNELIIPYIETFRSSVSDLIFDVVYGGITDWFNEYIANPISNISDTLTYIKLEILSVVIQIYEWLKGWF